MLLSLIQIHKRECCNAADYFSIQLLPGLAAQFFAHVNCLNNMSKNLSFVKNQLIAQFLQPKKMSKNLSSGFTAICSIATCQSLFTVSLLAVKAALRHILTNANGLDCTRLICFGCSGRLRIVSMVLKTGIFRCKVGLPTSWILLKHL